MTSHILDNILKPSVFFNLLEGS